MSKLSDGTESFREREKNITKLIETRTSNMQKIGNVNELSIRLCEANAAIMAETREILRGNKTIQPNARSAKETRNLKWKHENG